MAERTVAPAVAVDGVYRAACGVDRLGSTPDPMSLVEIGFRGRPETLLLSVVQTHQGPNGNFSRSGSHVLPALIRRYDEAASSDAPSVSNWGTRSPRREFLHADDMADACLHLLEHYDGPGPINVGTGADVTTREIAENVASAVGYAGETKWDTTKSDGTPQKLLDVTKLIELGWTSKIGLQEGIERTADWYHRHIGALRV